MQDGDHDVQKVHNYICVVGLGVEYNNMIINMDNLLIMIMEKLGIIRSIGDSFVILFECDIAIYATGVKLPDADSKYSNVYTPSYRVLDERYDLDLHQSHEPDYSSPIFTRMLPTRS